MANDDEAAGRAWDGRDGGCEDEEEDDDDDEEE